MSRSRDTSVVVDNVEQVIDTLAELASVVPDKYKSVRVLGFHERGDGGGGVFFWDDSKSQSEHNGGTIIAGDAVLGAWDTAGQEAWFTAPSVGIGCWVREYSGAVNVKWFGSTDTNNMLGANDKSDEKIVEVSDGFDALQNNMLALGKDLYGIRRNACVASFRANNELPFNTQVTGVEGSEGLAEYGSVDSVTTFMDIKSKPYKTWEEVSTVDYSEQGFVSSEIDFSELKIGMIAKTDHAEPWFGFVSGFEASTNTVFVDKWSKKGAPLETVPTQGTGLHMNPENKVWALNANAFLNSNEKADNAVLLELGLINNKVPSPDGTNGIDMVILNQSAYGGNSAYYARTSSATGKWDVGFISDNSEISDFQSRNSFRGFTASNTVKGYVYASDSTDINDRAISVLSDGNLFSSEVMGVGGDGKVVSMPRRVKVLADGSSITRDFPINIYGGTGAINVSVPNGSVDGDIVKVVSVVNGSQIILSGNLVGSAGATSSITITGNVNVDLIYIGGLWYVS